MNQRLATCLLIGLAVAVGVGLICVSPIRQDEGYHRFADTRVALGTPSAWNVWSNVPLVIAGMVGLWRTAVSASRAKLSPADRRDACPTPQIWATFFVGVMLTGFGSVYYHLAPNDATLVWDRLPMTVAFTAFFAALVADRINPRTGERLFAPLVAAGLGSVVYWHYTGDLRLYALVQLLPIALIPLMIWFFPRRFLPGGDVLVVLGWYVVAKVCERLDAPLFDLTGISGHTWKHFAAAAGAAWVVMALRKAEVAQHGEVHEQTTCAVVV